MWTRKRDASRTTEAAGMQRQGQRAVRVKFDVMREGKSVFAQPFVGEVDENTALDLPGNVAMRPGDEIHASLQTREDGPWQQVGSEIRYRIREGAPFTFGRALGLGNEPIDHGTQLHLDGVAVFDRVLSGEELRALSFRADAQ
jgi:hypothetical protein